MATPGHTDGNQSLCVNTPEGIWVSSDGGINYGRIEAPTRSRSAASNGA